MPVTVHPLLRCFGFYRRYPWMFIASVAVALLVLMVGPMMLYAHYQSKSDEAAS